MLSSDFSDIMMDSPTCLLIKIRHHVEVQVRKANPVAASGQAGKFGIHSTNVNGGLSYQFTFTEDRYQLHPEKTTLTKAFAPQWIGDISEPQIISVTALVSQPRDVNQTISSSASWRGINTEGNLRES